LPDSEIDLAQSFTRRFVKIESYSTQLYAQLFSPDHFVKLLIRDQENHSLTDPRLSRHRISNRFTVGAEMNLLPIDHKDHMQVRIQPSCFDY
jgi:hypothetical protein